MKPDNLEEKFKDQVHTKKQSKSTKKTPSSQTFIYNSKNQKVPQTEFFE